MTPDQTKAKKQAAAKAMEINAKITGSPVNAVGQAASVANGGAGSGAVGAAAAETDLSATGARKRSSPADGANPPKRRKLDLTVAATGVLEIQPAVEKPQLQKSASTKKAPQATPEPEKPVPTSMAENLKYLAADMIKPVDATADPTPPSGTYDPEQMDTDNILLAFKQSMDRPIRVITKLMVKESAGENKFMKFFDSLKAFKAKKGTLTVSDRNTFKMSYELITGVQIDKKESDEAWKKIMQVISPVK